MTGGAIFEINQSPDNLPQESDIWYLVIRNLHTWLEIDDGSLARPYISLLVNLDYQIIAGVDVSPNEPTLDQIIQFLFRVMVQPAKETGQPAHRPKAVYVEENKLAQAIESELGKIAVAVSAQPPPLEIDQIVSDMEDILQGQELTPPGLLSVQGVKPEVLASLFSASADFYRAAPWQHLSDAQPLAIKLASTGEEGFIQLMGNAGLEFGLVLYWDWDDLLHTYQGSDDPLEQLPPGGWRSLTFEDADLLPWEDLEAIEDYGWQVAGEHAYPLLLNYSREDITRPTRREIIIYEALLRAIPRFVEGYLHPDGRGDYCVIETEIEVVTFDGKETVILNYPAGEFPDYLVMDLEEDDQDQGYTEEYEPNLDDSIMMISRSNWGRRIEEGELTKSGSDHDESDLAVANRIMVQAWNEENADQRVILARQALKISHDCTDAFLLIAEEQTETLEEACEFFRQGYEAGERVLGEGYFKENVGHFWGLTETRPYMRARQGYADCLAQMGAFEEALVHYRALLELNPNDNQGVRYSLLALFLRLRLDHDAVDLWAQYDQDETAAWVYSRALLDYRSEGASAQALVALREAIDVNPHVPDLLTGRSPMPLELPLYIRLGDESEAMHYVAENYMNWWGTSGAVEWLKNITSQSSKRPRE